MSTVQDAIEAIQDIAIACGVRYAPDEPPDKITQGPMAITYARGGTWKSAAGMKTGIHTIIAEFHMPLRSFANDLALVRPYIETFANAILADPTLAGTVGGDGGVPMTYEYFMTTWPSNVYTIGYRFIITVKQQSAIT